MAVNEQEGTETEAKENEIELGTKKITFAIYFM